MPNKIISYNPNLKELARKLRNNCTHGEAVLWAEIRKKALGVEFHRQVPIDNYIVDFYCHEILLAIEIDGNIHEEVEVRENDIFRQDKLESLGVRFIRFDDNVVKTNIVMVIEKLQLKIDELKINLVNESYK